MPTNDWLRIVPTAINRLPLAAGLRRLSLPSLVCTHPKPIAHDSKLLQQILSWRRLRLQQPDAYAYSNPPPRTRRFIRMGLDIPQPQNDGCVWAS